MSEDRGEAMAREVGTAVGKGVARTIAEAAGGATSAVETAKCETCERVVLAAMVQADDIGAPVECPACSGEPVGEVCNRVHAYLTRKKAICLCPGCAETIPAWWASGLCTACASLDCEHEIGVVF